VVDTTGYMTIPLLGIKELRASNLWVKSRARRLSENGFVTRLSEKSSGKAKETKAPEA